MRLTNNGNVNVVSRQFRSQLFDGVRFNERRDIEDIECWFPASLITSSRRTPSTDHIRRICRTVVVERAAVDPTKCSVGTTTIT